MTTLVQQITQTIKDNVAKVIVGKDDVVELREVEYARQAWAELQPHGNGSGRVGPMIFHSILFEKTEDGLEQETVDTPNFFRDLNLDQLINAITADKKEYNLKPFFYTPLHDSEAIHYRHEVMQDMADETLMAQIEAFAEKMTIVRRYLALIEKLDFNYHKKGWFLEAALVYCDAITGLARDLSLANLKSRGLLAFYEYMDTYVNSPGFQSLLAEAQAAKSGLSGVKYSMIVQIGKFSVKRYDGETDYSLEVEKVFEKFKQGMVEDYRVKLYEQSGMNHIEAKILEFVTRLYPELFAVLDRFCAGHSRFIDETIRVFDREIQFYIAYLEFIIVIKRQGLSFCYPQVSATRREVYNYDGFDLALANTLLSTKQRVVCNDFFLEGPERIIVVSGPNQGGKTTFARMFGQLHYLASLGCPCRAGRRSSFCSTRFLPILSGRKTSTTCAANCRMTWCVFTIFSPRPRPIAFSS